MINSLDPNKRKNIDKSSRSSSDFAMSVFDQYVLNSSSKGSAGINDLFKIVIIIHLDMPTSNLGLLQNR